MAPKQKDKDKDARALKKHIPTVVRPAISESELCYVPPDAVEGYQHRLDSCVTWSDYGNAIRHHKIKCAKTLPEISFSDSFQYKIDKSILRGFLDERSSLSIREHWEVFLPQTIFNNKVSTAEEAKICFDIANNITNRIEHKIKKAAAANSREKLKKELRKAEVLRLIDAKMTHLDEKLKEFPYLASMSLCGNYISEIDGKLLPRGLRMLELQFNRISDIQKINDLPNNLLYIGLSKNLLTNDGINNMFTHFPYSISVLDLSDNDIYDLYPVLNALSRLPNLTSLQLAGNPCSLCSAYATTTLHKLQRLHWLDNRQVLPFDRPEDNDFEPHPDELKSAYFCFTVLRIMSAPLPPKLEKGTYATIHVDLELPLLDPVRRNFLMYHRVESLTEILLSSEDESSSSKPTQSISKESKPQSKESKLAPHEAGGEEHSVETNIYDLLEPKKSDIIIHYTEFESNRIPWNKVMNFQEPTVRIFCPDLMALRNTFWSTITLRVIYTLHPPTVKQTKHERTSIMVSVTKQVIQSVTLATIKCTLRNPDWSQNSQHFHWDEAFGTKEAIHWGVNDLAVLPYQSQSVATGKDRQQPRPSNKKTDDNKTASSKLDKLKVPESFTCQFSFGIETLRP